MATPLTKTMVSPRARVPTTTKGQPMMLRTRIRSPRKPVPWVAVGYDEANTEADNGEGTASADEDEKSQDDGRESG